MSVTAVHLVIPIKNPVDAKQRLSDVMSPDDRELFFRAMVADLFATVAQCREFGSVNVVTRDEKISEHARQGGFVVVRESSNDGHTAAVTRGFAHVLNNGGVAAMTLPADLPCLRAHDIESVLAQFRLAQTSREPCCVLVPAADYAGTNAAVLSPPDLFDFSFGSNSFYPHVDAAKRAGVDPVIVENDNIAVDIDTPDDLSGLSRKSSGACTAAWLRENSRRLAHHGVKI